MDKQWFRIFCILNAIFSVYSAGYKAGQPNTTDSNAWFKNFLNGNKSSLLKKTSSVSGMKSDNISVFSENFANISKCSADLVYIRKNLNRRWALQLIDSFGKPMSGTFTGNIKWVGEYSECLGVRASNPNSSTVGNFRGKYCTVTWSVGGSKLPRQSMISTGICIPDSCSAKQISEYVPQLLRTAGVMSAPEIGGNLILTIHLLKCPPIDRPFNTPAKAVIAVLSVFVAFTVLGSSITAVKRLKKAIKEHRSPYLLASTVSDNKHVVFVNGQPDKKELWQSNVPDSKVYEWLHKLKSFLGCFCIFTNSAKLFNTDTSEGELLCLHGIRFLSMCWVILGHTYMLTLEEIKGIVDVRNHVQHFLYKLVSQSFYSVESFFVMSGFLLAYLSTKEFTKTKRSVAWHSVYLNRYIRLTPLYMMVVAFSATVFFYLGSGPYWSDGDADKNCRRYWWRNMLYINNLCHADEQCMIASWYLANDMQFLIISPLFMIPLWRRPKLGYFVIGSATMASWLCTFFISYQLELEPSTITLTSGSSIFLAKYTDYNTNLYIKPYTRIDSYLIGLLTGYILFKRRSKKNHKHGWTFLCMGWIVSSVITLTCIFGLHGRNPSLIASSFYNALNRSGFSLGVAWVIYVCLIGQGGFVNSMLSCKLFVPLSRLTYGVYLIQDMILRGYLTTTRYPIPFSHRAILFSYLGFVVVTFAAAVPVVLMLEYPIAPLGKLLTKGLVKQEKTKGSD